TILILSDVLNQEECETEDIIGEEFLLSALNELIGSPVSLDAGDREAGSIIDQIKAAAQRQNIDLPDGWKPELARRIVVRWSTTNPKELPDEILDRAEALF